MTVYYTADPGEKSILFAYHLAKPWWWRQFWGWRSTRGSVCRFIIPNKQDLIELYKLIEYAKGEETK